MARHEARKLSGICALSKQARPTLVGAGKRDNPAPADHPGKEAPKFVGSNGETVRLKGERAFEVAVWTLNRRCRLL